jgi:hypothetical protein
MRARSTRRPPRTRTGNIAGKNRRDRRLVRAVMRAVQDHFAGKRTKLHLELALRTEAHPRNAEKWLAGGSPAAKNLIELLRSDIGDVVLAGALGSDPKNWPAWYVAMKRQLELSHLRRALETQRKAIETLEREAVR